VFHVTQLKKGMHVPENEVITEANAWIEPDFSLIEHPLRVLDRKERKTRRQTIRMYKIQWSHHTEEEATWETKEYLKPSTRASYNLKTVGLCYLSYFLKSNLGTRFRSRGVGCDALGFYLTLIVGRSY
jgi:hypothetical protein